MPKTKQNKCRKQRHTVITENSKNSLNKMSAITFLPSEIIDKILSSLSPRDLKSAVLVCKMWREVGESSTLWSWANVKICPGNVGDILTSRRLQIVQEIVLFGGWQQSDCEQVEQLLQTLGRSQKLKIFCFGDLDLSGVEESIVSCLVNKMKEIDMGFDDAVPETVKIVLSVIRHDTQLRKIDCECYDIDLSSIQPDSLATAVHRLVEVRMDGIILTTEQLTHILLKMNETSKLKYLDISGNNCSSVKPDIMAKVNKLEKVWMAATNLTTVQITCILTQAVKNTKLKLLDCCECYDLKDVDQELVREAGQKIAKFDYYDGYKRVKYDDYNDDDYNDDDYNDDYNDDDYNDDDYNDV